ncbi:hypothetical protein Plhal304r1_c024g0082911 [Plasmopara halstedii]
MSTLLLARETESRSLVVSLLSMAAAKVSAQSMPEIYYFLHVTRRAFRRSTTTFTSVLVLNTHLPCNMLALTGCLITSQTPLFLRARISSSIAFLQPSAFELLNASACIFGPVS